MDSEEGSDLKLTDSTDEEDAGTRRRKKKEKKKKRDKEDRRERDERRKKRELESAIAFAQKISRREERSRSRERRGERTPPPTLSRGGRRQESRRICYDTVDSLKRKRGEARYAIYFLCLIKLIKPWKLLQF